MKKNTLKINPDNCIGCGTCAMIAPDFFKINEKIGKAVVKKQPEKTNKLLKEAMESCPTEAIILESTKSE